MKQLCWKTSRAPPGYLNWGENLSSQKCTPKTKSWFFNLKLTIQSNGIRYSDDLEHYEEEILNAIWETLEFLQIHPNLEVDLNTKFLWNPLLKGGGRNMGFLEKPIIKNVRLIKKFIKRNKRILSVYLDKYSAFEWLTKFDPLFVTQIYTQQTKEVVVNRIDKIIDYIIALFVKGHWMHEINMGIYPYRLLNETVLNKLTFKGSFDSVIANATKLFWADEVVISLCKTKYSKIQKKSWFFYKYFPYIERDDARNMLIMLCWPLWIYQRLEKLTKRFVIRLREIMEKQPFKCKFLCERMLDLKDRMKILRKYTSLDQVR
ncbi:unnamed protein product [Nezara viridula]|uniref:Uncharacterized protein n=1 Tax=Nezara viridula TaxID=85310 RepID=A0A9P0EFJ5_NEZVI|nr:unnamed protein product [Nezara viridula]